MEFWNITCIFSLCSCDELFATFLYLPSYSVSSQSLLPFLLFVNKLCSSFMFLSRKKLNNLMITVKDSLKANILIYDNEIKVNYHELQ